MISGACLVVAEPAGHLDPEYLDETIRRESITTMHFVPAMLRNFLGEAVGPWPSLRTVICSGETLDRDLVEMWYGRCNATLHNLYGPAEAAVDVTSSVCERNGSGAVPIGKPIANTRIYVLDHSLHPAPINVAGEIFIGGMAVGRGYLNAPELTASKFLPDPFSDEPGARMYRTGDRGRYLRDGNLEFLGRLDNQIKIRGQRIELGEIESILRGLEGVSNAAVLLDGSSQLVAWVVPDRGVELESADLRRQLADRLPRYMIPQQFHFRPELPLNASGKVDRRRLLSEEVKAKDDEMEALLARVEILDDAEVQKLLSAMSA
jgi:acyl-CoA synthetase (AMP-forming)/AMP-acid ligase II